MVKHGKCLLMRILLKELSMIIIVECILTRHVSPWKAGLSFMIMMIYKMWKIYMTSLFIHFAPKLALLVA